MLRFILLLLFRPSVSRIQLFATLWTVACKASLSFMSLRACSNSCSLSRWSHLTTSSSVIPFSSCLQSFSAFGSFPMSLLLISGAQSTGASASASVFLMNIQGWFPIELTGLTLLSKGLSRVLVQESSPSPQFKASILQHLAFFMVKLSHLYMTTGKTP